MKMYDTLSRWIIPSELLLWYSRVEPQELRNYLERSSSGPKLSANPFKAPELLYYSAHFSGNVVRLTVRLDLVVRGTLTSYANGSLLRGRLEGGGFTGLCAWALAIMALPIIGHFLYDALTLQSLPKQEILNTISYILFAFSALRFQFMVQKQGVLHLLRGRLVAREISEKAVATHEAALNSAAISS